MDAGRLNRRAAFYRRAVLGTPNAGNTRGGFEQTPFLTVWADFRQTPGREVVSAGLAEDQIGGTLRIRDSAKTREITSADRCVMKGVSFALVSVALAETAEGYIDIVLRREVAG